LTPYNFKRCTCLISPLISEKSCNVVWVHANSTLLFLLYLVKLIYKDGHPDHKQDKIFKIAGWVFVRQREFAIVVHGSWRRTISYRSELPMQGHATVGKDKLPTVGGFDGLVSRVPTETGNYEASE
jgi:hypothetical protein